MYGKTRIVYSEIFWIHKTKQSHKRYPAKFPSSTSGQYSLAAYSILQRNIENPKKVLQVLYKLFSLVRESWLVPMVARIWQHVIVFFLFDFHSSGVCFKKTGATDMHYNSNKFKNFYDCDFKWERNCKVVLPCIMDPRATFKDRCEKLKMKCDSFPKKGTSCLDSFYKNWEMPLQMWNKRTLNGDDQSFITVPLFLCLDEESSSFQSKKCKKR